MLNWYYKKLGTNNNVNIHEMDELPIRQFSPSKQKIVEKIVDKLLKIKEDNSGKSIPDSDLSSLQSEIDSMVYDLYEVNEVFRQIIDSDMGV